MSQAVRLVCVGMLAAWNSLIVSGQEQARPEPTHANVSYGPHERNVVDFYQAKSDGPAPVLVYFHGGGFRGGSKDRINGDLHRLCMQNGISFAAANYRLSSHAPYPAQMHDSARALQLIRSKATDWNLDPTRMAAFGGSAGAGISLWLAMHDDLAQPESDDVVARQSTRLSCAIGLQAQSTYDPREIRKVVPGGAYNHPALKHLFALPADWDWDTATIDRKLDQQLRDSSPVNHLTDDDVPIFVYHRDRQDKPGDIHHGNFGRYLKQKMDSLGIECLHRMDSDFEDEAERNRVLVDFVKKHFGG